MDTKIHVAYGFHVNCYHSYRGDTPDEKGFGSDLRIIRKIIGTLDALNAEGILVKGTWDTENFFSLEKILPEHAPDIIDGLRRRTRENGDEHLIMGYTNGALGAMTPEELAASIDLSVTNEAGSGLQDLFGACERIVRPQEVMFSPPQVPLYNKLGVKGLCLYYSCVPFDAFQTLIPPLADEYAFNPLTFTYQEQGLTVIPTISNADVCDAGCLRALVRELRRKQESGEILHDLFIFINMDADAIFWESLGLPLIGNRLANTDGINGLVREVADLDYVVFDTPGGYLKKHSPIKEISFGQDTADGNFTGYASWSEKPYNRTLWTVIERARLFEKLRPDEEAFRQRLQLLSTTHFGLATPVLNISREKKANELASALTERLTDRNGPLTVHTPNGETVVGVQLTVSGAAPEEVSLSGDDLIGATLLPAADGESLFAVLRFSGNARRRVLNVTRKDAEALPSQRYRLCSGDTEICFSVLGTIDSLTCDGIPVGGKDLLRSYLTYDGKRFDFRPTGISMAPVSGGVGIRLQGKIELPHAIRQGDYTFEFFTSAYTQGIFVKTEIRYPLTPEFDAISTENSTLGRFTDAKWEEVVPFSLTPIQKNPVRVLKRNFMPARSSFSVSSFGKANPANRSLDSFNNHLSAGLVGVTDGNTGLLLGNVRSVLSAMAYCPMRLQSDGATVMNPFGTFYGRQRTHRSRSNGRIPQTYTLIAPQGKSLAPAYNGASERAFFRLLPFLGEGPDGHSLSELLSFADGAAVTGESCGVSAFTGTNAVVNKASAESGTKMRSPLMTGIRGNLGKYVVRGVRAIAYIARRQYAAKD